VRVLVTGAAGFIGGAVATHLARAGHHQVTALVHERAPAPGTLPPEVATAWGDVLDRESLRRVTERGCFEGVCHLAALTAVRASFREPERFLAVNLDGTANLLTALAESSRATGVRPRIVFASTAAVYGEPECLPVSEEHPERPTSPYGASKLAADHLLRRHAEESAMGTLSLRCFNVAGAVDGHRDRDLSRLVPRAVSVAAGLADHLAVNGDGSAVREFVHVADLAAAYALALHAAAPGRHRVLNVGSGAGVRVREVIDAVERVSGRRVPVVRRPPAPEPQALVADSTRIRAELGWRPERSDLDSIVADAWEAAHRG
jgi:UDP-glucose 4-epimerase